jgi:hypothetical protein
MAAQECFRKNAALNARDGMHISFFSTGDGGYLGV